jgi:L-asparaginase II
VTDANAAPAALTDAPVLAHLVRGGFVETVHRASVAVTEADGSVLRSWGSVDTPVFPRSSNKPLQALAMLRAGLDIDGAELAVACASHSGEPYHQDAARSILERAGLSEGDLQNTPTLPLDEAEQHRWIRAGLPQAAIAQNCSGKHAAMLATCVGRGWDTATYRDPAHPLQVAIRETIEELTGDPVDHVAVDGCGAPVMSVTLTGLARAFGRLAAAEPGSLEGRLAAAMREHPEYVGGTGRDVTALMVQTPGLIAKDGAESMYAVGLADGRGVAVKVADGASRAKGPILAAVLAAIGVDSPALASLADVPVLGHGEPVGALVAVGI